MLTSTEARKCTVLLTTTTCPLTDVLHRFSSLDKVLHVVAYCLRLSKSRPSGSFTHRIEARERAHALSALMFKVQKTTYATNFVHQKRFAVSSRHSEIGPLH